VASPNRRNGKKVSCAGGAETGSVYAQNQRVPGGGTVVCTRLPIFENLLGIKPPGRWTGKRGARGKGRAQNPAAIITKIRTPDAQKKGYGKISPRMKGQRTINYNKRKGRKWH